MNFSCLGFPTLPSLSYQLSESTMWPWFLCSTFPTSSLSPDRILRQALNPSFLVSQKSFPSYWISRVMNTALCAHTQVSSVISTVSCVTHRFLVTWTLCCVSHTGFLCLECWLFVHTQVLVCLLLDRNAKFIPFYLILVSFFFFLLLISVWKFSSLSFKCFSHYLELYNSSKLKKIQKTTFSAIICSW